MSFEEKTPNNFFHILIFCYFVDSFFANDELLLIKNKAVVLSLTQYSKIKFKVFHTIHISNLNSFYFQ